MKKLKNKVVYEIYPRSFNDSNNDGIGDLKGITLKLDYLKELGVDYIWMTPINKSPMVDSGYDVSDYYDIDPEIGTIEDFEELVKEAKKRKIGIIFDLVINHTSDKHQWFQKAISGDKKYQDYYYFVDGKNVPNQWVPIFGKHIWEYVEKVDKSYMHIFTKEQPDLNWYNDNVIKEMADIANFWIDKGVEGFRVDAIIHIGRDDFNVQADLSSSRWRYTNQKDIKPLFNKFKSHLKKDVLLVGESSTVNEEEYKWLTNKKDGIVDISCIFYHMEAHRQGDWSSKPNEINSEFFFNTFKKWQEFLDKNDLTISISFGSHDHTRVISAYGNPTTKETWKSSGKALAGFLHFLKGMPFIYQGEEIGMIDYPYKSIDEVDDIKTKESMDWMLNDGFSKDVAFKTVIRDSRDHARTIMQWTDKKYAGFSETKPWIVVNPSKSYINAESSTKDEDSIFNFYKKLIQIRKKSEVVQEGSIKFIQTNIDKVFYYVRELNNKTLHVYTNLSNNNVKTNIEDGKVFVNSHDNYKAGNLQPYQFIVIEK